MSLLAVAARALSAGRHADVGALKSGIMRRISIGKLIKLP